MPEEKRNNNLYFGGGRYLIEHQPSEIEPYRVYDLAHIFDAGAQDFGCATLEQAKELCLRHSILMRGLK